MESVNPELVDELDGKTHVLTATRCYVTWQVQRGHRLMTERKRFRRGEAITGVPEFNLAKLVKMGHAVPEDEYDPEAIEQARTRKRLSYDQNAASSALLELTMERNRRERAGGGNVGLPDADAPARLTDSGREVDGIKVEDVDPDSGGQQDDDESLTSTEPTGGEGDAVPDYRSYDYPKLQQFAKETTGSGAGGKDELITRLDEHFARQQ